MGLEFILRPPGIQANSALLGSQTSFDSLAPTLKRLAPARKRHFERRLFTGLATAAFID